MKIILVAADAHDRNMVFVSDTLQAFSLEEAVVLARKGTFDNVYAVKRGSGTYLRTKPNISKKEQLERLSISSHRLFSSLDNINYGLTTPAFSDYWLAYKRSLQERDKNFIIIEGHPRIIKETAREKIAKTSRSYLYKYVVQPKHNILFAAAKMRSLIDVWRRYSDISSAPAVVATLYSLKGKMPHPDPKPNDRGLQISEEFYQFAKEWLR